MNIMLIADSLNSEIKKMFNEQTVVNWQYEGDLFTGNTSESDSAEVDMSKASGKPKTEQGIDYHFYVISPREDQQIPACIPQLIEDSNKRPQQTLFCFVAQTGEQFFTSHQIKSLKAIGQMVSANGANWLENLPINAADWQTVLGNGTI
ncbi:hypothetical protein [Colwellia psychrerythraea]|uniref:Uncharacterized protein n=1 Tax=Colwellia psychrerythraea TaxID=28229 RepID=A0A099KC64_COLPS|nr:hypothetical protein [Colwellia psychrerythraea]KGJ87956.1 hypothetical protein GAB14E_4289 [Colwellia psychrerythraea]